MTTAVAVGTRLELDDVRLSYTGAPVVDGLSLSVQPGEILVLTGPSGCGKSTVLRALAGLLRPDSGRVLADGHEVTATSRDRGMVFQDSALLPWRTVRSNIELALQLRGEPRAGRRERADRWIDEVGLAGFADYLPKSLSGGMRQRVQLARGLGRCASGGDDGRALRCARHPDPGRDATAAHRHLARPPDHDRVRHARRRRGAHPRRPRRRARPCRPAPAGGRRRARAAHRTTQAPSASGRDHCGP